MPKIVTLCGSQRIGSFNQVICNHATTSIEKAGGVVNPVNLAELNLPLYNPNDDVEGQFPDNAKYFKDQLLEAGTTATTRVI